MGRTNIPMALPPSTSYKMDTASVSLTPLSPQQMTENPRPVMEVPPLASHTPSGQPFDVLLPVAPGAPIGEGYYSYPNGIQQQAFFGASRIFPEQQDHFNFKLSPFAGTVPPLPVHMNVAVNGMDGVRGQRDKRTYGHKEQTQGPLDTSSVIDVVVQR